MTTPYKDVTKEASTSTSTLTPPTGAAPSERRASTSTTLNEDANAQQAPKQLETPVRYLYTERVAAPNPDYKPKPPSKFSKFLSKFQSPAVKGTSAARQREIDEEKRTGVRTYTPGGAPSGGSAWAANAVGFL